MSVQQNTHQIIGYASLCWEVSAVGVRGTVRVLAVNKYCAEREGAIKLGMPQWLCTARLALGLDSLEIA